MSIGFWVVSRKYKKVLFIKILNIKHHEKKHHSNHF